MKILIINSDSPNNRGDRAILLGGIKLIRQRFPESTIWSISDKPERDEEWFDINFLPMSVHTLNPINLLRLGSFAATCDIVFWGGGELLKDYTNKLGLIYWVVKILIVRIFNDNIYGFYQGIGPTKSSLSRRLITFVVNQTKRFFVRDEESAQKLLAWGTKAPVSASFDPAILCSPRPISNHEAAQLLRDFDLTPEFLRDAVGIGARNWFHYKTGSWIPFRFRIMLGLEKTTPSFKSGEYKRRLAKLCDKMVDERGVNIVFFPMHTSTYENDAGFSSEVMQLMKNQSHVRILDNDTLSPQAFHNTIGACRAFVSFRLHSFILATAALVPAIVFYYVDKGRLFADQVGLTDYCWAIEDLLDDGENQRIENSINLLFMEQQGLARNAAGRLEEMRRDLAAGFSKQIN